MNTPHIRVTIAAAALLLAVPAQAATLTVTNTADSGTGSLRSAIGLANLVPGSADTIAFDIPGAGPHRIQVQSALPALVGTVSIDGYTQPGAAPNTLAQGNNASIRVEINGDLLTGSGNSGACALVMSGRGIVRGLSLTGFDAGSNACGLRVASPDFSIIEGNWIGVRPDGSDGGNQRGLLVAPETAGTLRIGGTSPAARNVVSGNNGVGINLPDTAVAAPRIENNYVGTTPSGLAALPNGGAGVEVGRGGTLVDGNVIAGNLFNGLRVFANAPGTLVRGNRIGVGADGTTPLGNGADAVSFSSGATGARVGGDGGLENIIAHAPGAGIRVFAGVSGIVVAGNRIHSNAGLGIDLGSTPGVTPNDALDLDTGPNNQQNFPVLVDARRPADGGSVRVSGTLDSAPASRFRMRVHGDLQADPSGHGEGRWPAQSTFVVETDAQGHAAFGPVSLTFGAADPAPDVLSATATLLDAEGDDVETSEFGPAIDILPEAPAGTFVVVDAGDSGFGSLRGAIAAANASPNVGGSPDRITFAIPGEGPHTIMLQSELPSIQEPLVIDGYTQPGSVPNADVTGVGTDASLRIAIMAPPGGVALRVATGDSTLRGLSLFGGTSGLVELGTAPGHTANVVEGCWFGADPEGVSQPTSGIALRVRGASARIGGPEAAQRNLFSLRSDGIGAGSDGVVLSAADGVVQNNAFGTRPDGRTAVASRGHIHITAPGAQVRENVLAASVGQAILVEGAQAQIVDNAIGSSADGTTRMPNATAVALLSGAGTTISGPRAIVGNGIGVLVQPVGSLTGIVVAAPLVDNGTAALVLDGVAGLFPPPAFVSFTDVVRTSASEMRGIDLGGDGPTPNDPGDLDQGPNGLQNAPVILDASREAGVVTVTMRLDSVPNSSFRIRLCDVGPVPSVDGAGNCHRLSAGVATIETDASGVAEFVLVAADLDGATAVTATASRLDGAREETSEFALNRAIADGPPDALFRDGFEEPLP